MNCWCVAPGVQFLAVGDDFRFGAGRRGDFLLLQKAGRNMASTSPALKPSAKAGCESAARRYAEALADDDLLLAETLLGHPFSISGRVVHGDELGRTIGFPTANLPLRRQVSPG